jgi:hypothetical protein
MACLTAFFFVSPPLHSLPETQGMKCCYTEFFCSLAGKARGGEIFLVTTFSGVRLWE